MLVIGILRSPSWFCNDDLCLKFQHDIKAYPRSIVGLPASSMLQAHLVGLKRG